ncbi:MAG: hypothetical protein V4710_18655, partial [Verrucomicrobiota bacterium]
MSLPPASNTLERAKTWTDDPVMAPFKVAAKLGQAPGFAGPPDARAAEAASVAACETDDDAAAADALAELADTLAAIAATPARGW